MQKSNVIEVFKSKQLRRKFGHNMEGLAREQIKLYNETLEEWFVLFNTYCYRVQEVGMVV
jgi:hypothetical protein